MHQYMHFLCTLNFSMWTRHGVDSRVASRPSLVDTQNVWYRIDSEKDGIDASLFPT